MGKGEKFLRAHLIKLKFSQPIVSEDCNPQHGNKTKIARESGHHLIKFSKAGFHLCTLSHIFLLDRPISSVIPLAHTGDMEASPVPRPDPITHSNNDHSMLSPQFHYTMEYQSYLVSTTKCLDELSLYNIRGQYFLTYPVTVLIYFLSFQKCI